MNELSANDKWLLKEVYGYESLDGLSDIEKAFLVLTAEKMDINERRLGLNVIDLEKERKLADEIESLGFNKNDDDVKESVANDG